MPKPICPVVNAIPVCILPLLYSIALQCSVRSIGKRLQLPKLLDAIRATTVEVAGNPHSFDAVIVGSGAAGGLAAEILCEAGLQVLILDPE